jgi:phenylpropionate dioxygenase-like ring-hydroxylating dioxygenase large terminal subunit
MNVFSEYSQPTIDFIWELLEDAYEDEDKLDKLLAEIADDVFKEVRKILTDLEKSGRIDLEKKIRLGDHPAIYKALKDIEYREWRDFTEWCWIGY